ncbi:PASTA domain-containing protein [Nocardioides sp. TF02-7]|nr:PASTA domain-containing protein [Nocardioides sp. TF02-7]UMG92084.1 PASTA domain-containing protein [Nocardioides sp. TF02-7]
MKFVVGKVERRWSESVPEGEVIRSLPKFGTEKAEGLSPDTAIGLVVSKGRKPIKVGDWVGKDFETAKAELEDRGLAVEVVDREHSDTVDEGGVISHEPAEGTLFKGDVVEFVVSEGPELVEVPSVFYDPTEEAVATLEDLGFVVRIRHAPVYFTGERAYSTNPPAGTMAEKGSTITVYVV